MFTRVDFQVAANYTQQSFYDAVKAQLIAAGWGNPIDEYSVSTTKSMVFRPLTTGDYANRLHIRLELLSNFGFSLYVADGWNVGTHSSAKETPAAALGTLSATGTPINCSIFTSPTEGFVFLPRQGSTGSASGAMLMDVLMPGWDLAQYMPWLAWTGTQMSMPSGTGKNPWGSTATAVRLADVTALGLSTLNSLNNLRELVTGHAVANSMALIGYMPDSFGKVVSAGGGVAFDTYTVDGTSEVWTAIDAGSSAAFCLRTA